MYIHFFSHSFVNGHLGCFHILATVNTVIMNVGVTVSFQDPDYSLLTIPTMGWFILLIFSSHNLWI